jgi:protease-4
MTTAPSPLRRIGRALAMLWRGLDRTRRGLVAVLLNGLLLAGVAAALWLALRPAGPAIREGTALVVSLQGTLVEQAVQASARQRLLGAVQGRESSHQTPLRDVTAALDAAARDERIGPVLLMLDDFAGGSLPALREVAQAIGRVRAAGKPVFAWGSAYGQHDLFLAAHADEAWLHPEGAVWVDGYGRRRTHWRGLMEQVGLDAQVLRAGRYKNAMEPYAARRPSAETLESEGAVFGALWASYTQAVEQARRLEPGSLARAIDSLPQSLQATGGDAARWALQQKWVDRLMTRDELRAEMRRRGKAEGDAASGGFQQVSLADYLRQVEPARGTGGEVGIVVAQGAILDGRAGPGTVGGLSTAELVRRAREDKRIKAVVLRVDSPGGSAFGSELVRRELQLLREAGKPVVVSMGGLAASGGYWISMAADEVLADEATITGSIGVVGLLPNAAPLLERLDVHAEGVTTTWLRGAGDPRRAPDPRFAALIQARIDGGYRQFIELVAQARGKTAEQVDAVAQGRVWSGGDALRLGLVDRLGGLEDAVAAAATRAQLQGTPARRYIEAQPGRLERWLDRLGLAGLAATLGAEAAAQAAAEPGPLHAVQALSPWLAPLAGEAARLQALLALSRDAKGAPAALAHCLCDAGE